MSLRVLLSFLLASFLSTSFVCTSSFIGFGWAIGEICGWSHTRGTWGFGCFLGCGGYGFSWQYYYDACYCLYLVKQMHIIQKEKEKKEKVTVVRPPIEIIVVPASFGP